MNTAFSRVGFATLVGALAVAAAPARAGVLNFVVPPSDVAEASSVEVGDFNRDGKPDLVGANTPMNTVLVQLGEGAGSFRPSSSFGTGDTPISTAIADLNRDGALDLVTANCGQPCNGNGSGNLSVLLGHGDGTFGEKTDLPVGAGGGPRAVAVTDLNRDGKLDLVSAGSMVWVLLGNGDGTFGAPTDFVGQGVAIAVGDFNRDGKQDVSVVNGEAFPQGVLSVLLGNGDGTFRPKDDYPMRAPSDVAVGDLNADGAPDLVAPNSFDANSVTVLLGHGDGTFRAGKDYSTRTDCAPIPPPPDVVWAQSCSSDGVAIADFDLNGRLDLAVANQTATRLMVLLGRGDGTFVQKREVISHPARAIAAAYLTADRWPDLVTNRVALINGSTAELVLAANALTANGKGVVKLPVRNRNVIRVTGKVALRCAEFAPTVDLPPCRGGRTASPVATAKHKKKRVVTLGQASFAIGAEKTSSVSVKLSKAGEALLAKRGTLRTRVAFRMRLPGFVLASFQVVRLTARKRATTDA